MLHRRPSLRLVLVAFCLTVANCQLPGFRNHPMDTIAIKGDTTILQCRTTAEAAGAKLLWYKDGVAIGENNTFSDGVPGRFSINGDWTAGEYDLKIKDTQVSDSGEYYCQFSASDGDTSISNIATLTVIQPVESWHPKCFMYLRENSQSTEDRLASSGFIVGDKVAVECVSSGEPVPELTWREDGRLVPGELDQNFNYSMATNIFAWTLSERDDGALYICSANLPTLARSPFCTIGPLDIRVVDTSGIAMIPAIITGALAAVAVILFFVVLILLFKYRQCKICRDLPDFHEPVEVAMPDAVGQLPSPIPSSETDEDDRDSVDVVVVRDGSTQDAGQSTAAMPSPNERQEIPKLNSSSIIRNIDQDNDKQLHALPQPGGGDNSTFDTQSLSSDSPNANVEREPEPQPSTSFRPPPPIPADSSSVSGDTSPRVLELEEESIYYIPKEPQTKKGKGAKTAAKKKEKKQQKKEKKALERRKRDPDYIDDPVVYAEINFSKDVGMNIIIENKDLNK